MRAGGCARSTATATVTGPLRSRGASNARSTSPRKVARSVSPQPSALVRTSGVTTKPGTGGAAGATSRVRGQYVSRPPNCAVIGCAP